MPEWNFYPAHQRPTALDIVWCRFPLVEDPNNPASKPRPGLVRTVRNKNGNFYVEVAFGTSNPKRYSEHDLYIANLADLIEFGLSQATIFTLDRTATIPWSEEWCVKTDNGAGPVIGQLNDRYKEYLRQILRR